MQKVKKSLASIWEPRNSVVAVMEGGEVKVIPIKKAIG